MTRASASLLTVVLLAACGSAQRPTPGPIELASTDGITVHADWLLADREDPRGTIVLFHQGGGEARGEYERIAPRLQSMGYDLLAADLRRGGNRFGRENRTAPPGADTLFSYCDALPDVEAAIQEASRFGPVILWGSSFSGALVVHAAAAHPHEVKAVLAFSPASGDPMTGCRPEAVSGSLDMPFMALRPAREAEIPSVRAQLAEFQDEGHITYVSSPGTHGSSMLDEERTGASTEEAWLAVEAFLTGLLQVE